MSAPTWAQLAGALRIGQLIVDGDYARAARQAVELGLDLVPVDELRGYLTDAAAKRAELAADIAEDIKVGPDA